MKRITILAAVSALTFFGVACSVPPKTTGGVITDSNNSEHKPQADVAVTTCSNGEYLPKVVVTITNNTSKRSNYTVNVNLTTAGGTKVGDGIVYATNIEPGQTSIEDVLATSNGHFDHCQVVEVQRYAA